MSKELFNIIFENFKDGFLVVDKDGIILYVNDSYCQMSNKTREELLGRNYADVLEEDPKFVGGAALSHVFMHNERIEEVVEDHDNEEEKLHITGIPLYDEDGSILYGMVGVISLGNMQNLYDYLTEDGRKNIRDAIKVTNQMCPEEGAEALIAESESMQEAVSLALQVAPTDVSVLITGMSGTGKEVIANLIYQNSKRKDRPFIKINCSAIPANLLESELFGYADGAFTGAMKGGKPGLFEVANGGTVLLDEIGDMPMELQPKILRLLQNHEVMRVGGRDIIPLDIRLISATNKNLASAIVNKEFREDLYYRINIVPINLLPLQEREEDIGPLVGYFLKKYNTIYQKKMVISNSATALLKRYSWPGNIRELKNMIERMVVMTKGNVLGVEQVRNYLGIRVEDLPEDIAETGETLYSRLEALEKKLITDALSKSKSKRKAAEKLGIDHSTLIKKCKKYGL